jgi:hypothetical protein
MVAYINPVDVRDPAILASFLARLSSLLDGAPRWIIGGDFNAPTGSPQRRSLDRWCEEHGLALANPGTLTHFAGGEHRGSDLDLIWVRGVTVRNLAVHNPARGHARQVFEVEEVQAVRSRVPDWSSESLRNPSQSAILSKRRGLCINQEGGILTIELTCDSPCICVGGKLMNSDQVAEVSGSAKNLRTRVSQYRFTELLP